ncbi:polysaccharide deacetylase family protein [Georgenia yuyongxinii]|uniref:Polysaccharide deacetylase family protein n=1 Tax=Georgenia yuyongxinii TaxID=2589797 RepID=A0A552WMY6_9MICO|nr:polysaccharide deacetylase family protein [Georgenia yuyongxinii]TRW44141.1 polysaccharide deacetylase family protein [Georgenia yuyongxinii]
MRPSGARLSRGTGRRPQLAAALGLALLLGACSGPGTGGPSGPTENAGIVPTETAPTLGASGPLTPKPVPTAHTAGPQPSPAPSTTPPPSPAPAPTTESAPSLTITPTPAPGPSSAASGVPTAWRGQDVEVLPTSAKVVALTFDGGGSDAGVAAVLTTLDRYDVPATFFVTGAFARAYPEAVRSMAAAGHPVGNHSDTHPSFPDSTNGEIRDQLGSAEASIAALTGRSTKPLFRFPFGARTPADIAVVNDAGYIPFRWTVDSLGWQGTAKGLTADGVRQRVLDAARPGEIVLMHVGANPDDGTTFDADALPGIIEGFQAMGYGFVTLRELVG